MTKRLAPTGVGYAGSRSQSRPFDPADLMLDPVRPMERVDPAPH